VALAQVLAAVVAVLQLQVLEEQEGEEQAMLRQVLTVLSTTTVRLPEALVDAYILLHVLFLTQPFQRLLAAAVAEEGEKGLMVPMAAAAAAAAR
jgi:hypothetical protein